LHDQIISIFILGRKGLQRREGNFFWAGIHTPVERWKKSVNRHGNHIEKSLSHQQHCCKVVITIYFHDVMRQPNVSEGSMEGVRGVVGL